MVRKTRKNKKRTYKTNRRSYKTNRRSYKTYKNRRKTYKTNRRSYKNIKGGSSAIPEVVEGSVENLKKIFEELTTYTNKKSELRELEEKFSKYDKELGVQICEGVRLYGIQYCLKEKYRIQGKIDKKLLELDTIEEKKRFLLEAFAQDSVKDVLRFTMVFERPDRYLEKLQNINKQFRDKGLSLHHQHTTGEISADTGSSSKIPDISEERKIEKAFQILDKDGDGSINRQELENFLSNNGIEFNEQTFNQLDGNRDGIISSDEFQIYFSGNVVTLPVTPPTTPLERSMDVAPTSDIKTTILLYGEVLCLKEEYINSLFERANSGLEKMSKIFQELTLTLDGGGSGIKGIDRWHTDEPYKGINVVYLLELDGGNKLPVEIQYHTIESTQMKKIVHDLYEETQNLEYKITENKKKMLSLYRTLKPPFEKQEAEHEEDINISILYGQ